MDDGKGKFIFEYDPTPARMKRLESEHPEHGGWFSVGQIIEINGSKFRVKSVKPDELRLKLLPRERRERDG